MGRVDAGGDDPPASGVSCQRSAAELRVRDYGCRWSSYPRAPGFNRMLCRGSDTVLEPAQGAAPCRLGYKPRRRAGGAGNMERVTGTAPASSAWKAEALLLSYTRTVGGLFHRTTTVNLEGCPGVEPGIPWVATTCIADLPTAPGSCWSGWGESNTLRPAPKAGASPSGTIQVTRCPPRGTIPALCA